MSDSLHQNPYAVTSTIGLELGADAESIRKKHLSHEASVKSIGLLYWLGGILGCLIAVGYVVVGVGMMMDSKTIGVGIFILALSIFVGAFAIFQIYVAQGLQKLKPWSRTAATVISYIGLLGIPIGTLISAYFLYLLQSKKGEIVFSPQYQEVIAATPHIKYRTSIIVWILLGLLLALIGLGMLSVVIGSVSR